MEHCNGAHWIQLIYAYAALHSMYAGGSGQPDEHLVSRILLKDYTAGEPEGWVPSKVLVCLP